MAILDDPLGRGKPLLVTADEDARVSAWDVATGRFVGRWELLVRRDRGYATLLSPAVRRLAMLLQRFRGNSSFAPHAGSVLVVCEAVDCKLVWKHDANDSGNPTLQGDPQGHALAFSPDGRTLAVGTWRVDLFDAVTGRPVGAFDGHRDWITALRFSPDGRRLVSGSSDGTAVVWDTSAR